MPWIAVRPNFRLVGPLSTGCQPACFDMLHGSFPLRSDWKDREGAKNAEETLVSASPDEKGSGLKSSVVSGTPCAVPFTNSLAFI